MATQRDPHLQQIVDNLDWGRIFPNVRHFTLFGGGIAGIFEKFSQSLRVATLHSMPMDHAAQQVQQIRDSAIKLDALCLELLHDLRDGKGCLPVELFRLCLLPRIRKLHVKSQSIKFDKEAFSRWLGESSRTDVFLYGLTKSECKRVDEQRFVCASGRRRPDNYVFQWHDANY